MNSRKYTAQNRFLFPSKQSTPSATVSGLPRTPRQSSRGTRQNTHVARWMFHDEAVRIKQRLPKACKDRAHFDRVTGLRLVYSCGCGCCCFTFQYQSLIPTLIGQATCWGHFPSLLQYCNPRYRKYLAAVFLHGSKPGSCLVAVNHFLFAGCNRNSQKGRPC